MTVIEMESNLVNYRDNGPNSILLIYKIFSVIIQKNFLTA